MFNQLAQIQILLQLISPLSSHHFYFLPPTIVWARNCCWKRSIAEQLWLHTVWQLHWGLHICCGSITAIVVGLFANKGPATDNCTDHSCWLTVSNSIFAPTLRLHAICEVSFYLKLVAVPFLSLSLFFSFLWAEGVSFLSRVCLSSLGARPFSCVPSLLLRCNRCVKSLVSASGFKNSQFVEGLPVLMY